METPQHTPTGNTKVDGGLLLLIATGTIISKVTLSTVVTGLTAVGAILYIVNQVFILYTNIKNKKAK